MHTHTYLQQLATSHLHWTMRTGRLREGGRGGLSGCEHLALSILARKGTPGVLRWRSKTPIWCSGGTTATTATTATTTTPANPYHLYYHCLPLPYVHLYYHCQSLPPLHLLQFPATVQRGNKAMRLTNDL